jgi:hypothetical protein
MSSISLATPRAIAGKMASVINRRTCGECKRPYPDGVLAFGLSGSDPRWHPDEDTARRDTPGVRYLWPLNGHGDVTIDQIIGWLEEQRDLIEQEVEYLEAQREERRMARRMAEDNLGFRTDPYPCADCSKNGVTHYKHRPADRCDRCGDEPCPVGIDPHDYNRGYGYRD